MAFAVVLVLSAVAGACLLPAQAVSPPRHSHSTVCAAPGVQPPPPPTDVPSGWHLPPQLVQAQVFMSVGERERNAEGQCWVGDDELYNCTLSILTAPYEDDSGHSTELGRAYALRAVVDTGALPGTCFLGQLTSGGYQQQHFSGESLAQVYVGKGKLVSTNLSTALSTGQVYLRSFNQDASAASGQAFFSGFMPPLGGVGPVEIVDWHTVDQEYDVLVPNDNLCPKLAEYRSALLNSTTFQTHYNATVRPLLKLLSTITGLPESLVDLDLVQECVLSHYCQSRVIPANLTPNVSAAVMAETLYLRQFLYGDATYTKLAAGFLVQEVLSNFAAGLTNTSGPTRRFALYSGPTGGPVTQLLGALGVLSNLTGATPPFGSSVVLELYRVGPSATSFGIRVMYNNVPQLVGACPPPPKLCPLSTLTAQLAQLVPSTNDCRPTDADFPTPGIGRRLY